MKIVFLNKELEKKYDDFLLKSENTLFYASSKYRKLLKEFLKTEDYYFVALDDKNQILGVLPSFIKRNKKFGNVLNSLPFYGSNGAIIEHNNNITVRQNLIYSFYSFAQKQNCISTNIITNPFEKDVSFYEKNTNYTFIDKRIGQLTELQIDKNFIEEDLMKKFDSVRRRNIKKAQKHNIKVINDEKGEYTNFLIETHTQNIKSIGGIPKPKSYFDTIESVLEYNKDYKIFVGLMNNIPIASLLLVYFNKTVEYFIPAIKEEYRTFQPLSLIILEAMKDAVFSGYKWWNWGGTWLTQDGVYKFKKRWGTEDKLYYYFINIFDKKIFNFTRKQLLEEYPFFYVLPFDKLKSK